MKISRADQSALIIAFTEVIQRTHITDYRYAPVGVGWEDDAFSSLDPTFVKELAAKLDSSLESFFQERVFERFHAHGNKGVKSGSDPMLLTSCPGFEKPLEVAREFVEFMKTLPRKHRLYVHAGTALSTYKIADDDEVKISDQLSIINGSKFEKTAVRRSPNSEFYKHLTAVGPGRTYTDEIDLEANYFCFVQSGHYSDRWSPRLVSDMSDSLRATFGALCASGLLQTARSRFFIANRSAFPPAIRHIVVNDVEDDPCFLTPSVADDDLSEASALSLTQHAQESFDAGQDLSSAIEPATRLFASAERQRLSTAAIWLLRAYLSDRGMDEVLAAAICVEVLLGDRESAEKVGLTKLMANRSAYALGKTAIERRKIIDFFLNWYRVRSEIVHSGRMRISREENKIVKEGTHLAARILNHEAITAKDAEED